jgi:hypothetical protein
LGQLADGPPTHSDSISRHPLNHRPSRTCR